MKRLARLFLLLLFSLAFPLSFPGFPLLLLLLSQFFPGFHVALVTCTVEVHSRLVIIESSIPHLLPALRLVRHFSARPVRQAFFKSRSVAEAFAAFLPAPPLRRRLFRPPGASVCPRCPDFLFP
ncbi:unnamed protein product, partial [Ectocarpus sp. 12 AP-2014]